MQFTVDNSLLHFNGMHNEGGGGVGGVHETAGREEEVTRRGWGSGRERDQARTRRATTDCSNGGNPQIIEWGCASGTPKA